MSPARSSIPQRRSDAKHAHSSVAIASTAASSARRSAAPRWQSPLSLLGAFGGDNDLLDLSPACQTLATASRFGLRPYECRSVQSSRVHAWFRSNAGGQNRETPSPSDRMGPSHSRARCTRPDRESSAGLVRTRREGGTFAVRDPQRGDRHAVLGQRSSLVGAQHGRGPHRLDGGGAARQYPRPRDAPCAHGHEDRQHDGKLLGQHRHAEGDSGQYRLEPSASHDAVEQDR